MYLRLHAVSQSYRDYAAKLTMDRCQGVGLCLIANGTGIHAVPTGIVKKYPGLLFLLNRYRDEIMHRLDEMVE